MISLLFSNPIIFVIWAIALIAAVTIHEFAHAYTADKLGDPTPGLLGRVTLNPLAHLDPVGSVMMILVGFGWGKPVPFDPYNLRHPRRDAALISFAGPLSNILLASVLAVCYRLISSVFAELLVPFIHLNLILAFFNLIPIHPLDGFKIVGGMLSEHQAEEWQQLAPYGMYLLLFLLLPITPAGSLVSMILGPLLDTAQKILIG